MHIEKASLPFVYPEVLFRGRGLELGVDVTMRPRYARHIKAVLLVPIVRVISISPGDSV